VARGRDCRITGAPVTPWLSHGSTVFPRFLSSRCSSFGHALNDNLIQSGDFRNARFPGYFAWVCDRAKHVA
jgi:hypothetical protein